jgi:hypothetical protein
VHGVWIIGLFNPDVSFLGAGGAANPIFCVSMVINLLGMKL